MFRQRMGTLLPQIIRPRVQAQFMQTSLLLRLSSYNQAVCSPMMASPTNGIVSNGPIRQFATKKDDNNGEDPPIKKRRGRPPKVAPQVEEAVEAAPKKARATRAKATTKTAVEDTAAAAEETKKAPVKRTRKSTKKVVAGEPISMYVLKFNSPILPFAKFPLTHNRYIQEFIRMYEEDKDSVERIIGVHFPQNNNAMAEGAVGIEITVNKKNNMTMIESQKSHRFKIVDFDVASNFANVV